MVISGATLRGGHVVVVTCNHLATITLRAWTDLRLESRLGNCCGLAQRQATNCRGKCEYLYLLVSGQYEVNRYARAAVATQLPTKPR